jgi:hypothetical protein
MYSSRADASGSIPVLTTVADPVVLWSIKRRSGLCYFALAVCAGASVYLPNYHQYAHAFPPAIAIACAVASLVAGAAGWFLGPVYVTSRGRIPPHVWVPAVVYAVSLVVATVSYYVSLRAFLPYARTTFLVYPIFAQELLVYAQSYAVFSFPIWLVGLPICSYALHSKAVAYGN